MRDIPRFGATSDFSAVFGTSEEANGYVVGLLFWGCFMGSIFVAWTILLAVFKCLGARRVGFLSGSAFVRPSDPATDHRRPFVCRMVFLNATVLFIVFSVLFVTQGLTNIMATFDTVVGTAGVSSKQLSTSHTRFLVSSSPLLNLTFPFSYTYQQINSITSDIHDFMIQMEVVEDNATTVGRSLLGSLGGTQCLALRPGKEAETQEVISSLELSLIALSGFKPTENQTEEFKNATTYIDEQVGEAGKESENLTIGDWQSLLVIIPYMIVPGSLLLGVCIAWFDVDLPWLRLVLSYILLPIFIIQVIFAYSFSAALLLAASANADFCSGGETRTPDGTILSILIRKGFQDDDLVFRIAEYYIDQCVDSELYPFEFLERYRFQISASVEKLSEFTKVMADANIAGDCPDEVGVLDGLSRSMLGYLADLSTNIRTMLDSLDCTKVIALYTNPVYNGTCTYSITGFTWAFSTFAAVGAMGLIMIMLRSSWQLDASRKVEVEMKISEVDQDEYGGYTGYMEDFSEEETKEMVKEDDVFGQEQAAYGFDTHEPFQQDDFIESMEDDGDSFGDLQNRSRQFSGRFSLR